MTDINATVAPASEIDPPTTPALPPQPRCHAIAATFPQRVDAAEIERRLAASIQRHDVLRTRCRVGLALPELLEAPQPWSRDLLRIEIEDVHDASPDRVAETIDRLFAKASQDRVELGIAVSMARLPEGRTHAVLAVSPLVADASALLALVATAEGRDEGGVSQLQQPAETAPCPTHGDSAGHRFWQAHSGIAAGQAGPGGIQGADEHARRAQFSIPLSSDVRAGIARHAEFLGVRDDDLYFAAWAWLCGASAGSDTAPLARVLGDAIVADPSRTLARTERYLPFTLPSDFDPEAPDALGALARSCAAMRLYEKECPFRVSVAPPDTLTFAFFDLRGTATQVDRVLARRERSMASASIWMREGAGSLTLDFSLDRLTQPAAQVLLDQWLAVLRHLASSDSGASLALRLTRAQRDALLLLGSGPTVPRDAADTVIEMMNRRLASDGAGAVVDAERHSLQDIDARANGLARQLLAEGIGKGALVGLHLPRSANYVVAMLAVLKSGAAYLPLDLDFPSERIRYMLDSARPALVLTDTGGMTLATDVRTRTLAQAERDALAQSAHAPQIRIDGDDLAYVLYTSGSTGRPKGVSIPHRALANHMGWMLSEFAFDADDIFLQRTSSNFDASVWEFWAPMLVGGTMVIAPQGMRYDLSGLIRLIRDSRATVLQFVPSLLETLLECEAFIGTDAVRYVFAGGEALADTLRRKFHAGARARLVNLYGPTEACIDATFERCSPDDTHGGTSIGRPIWNTRAIVVDGAGRLAGIGIAGEICLAGDGLFQGYLGQPELTAAKTFVPEFSAERFYRTGDRGRLLRDGTVQYLGRMDQQVKLNGYRIELAEIDAVVAAQPGVRQVATVVGRTPKLVTFVRTDEGIDLAALMAAARILLPDYMVPARLLQIESWPLLSNGKLDRAALRELADAKPRRA